MSDTKTKYQLVALDFHEDKVHEYGFIRTTNDCVTPQVCAFDVIQQILHVEHNITNKLRRDVVDSTHAISDDFFLMLIGYLQ